MIADLSHKNNVGILAQDGSQPGRKGHTGLGIDLDLVYAIELIFNGIFHRDDVLGRRLHPIQSGVERRAFPAAGWTGN